jgi:hypothetical protein
MIIQLIIKYFLLFNPEVNHRLHKTISRSVGWLGKMLLALAVTINPGIGFHCHIFVLFTACVF